MNIRRISTRIGILLTALLLAACGAAKSETSGTVNPDRLNNNYTGALPVESQLMLGTLRLEGTPQAVDSAEAADLIPLYLLLRQLTTSGSAAQAEIDATLEAIQQAMTAEQIQAISAMKLTQSDLTSFSGAAGASGGSRTRTFSAGGGGNFPGGSAGGEGGFGGGAPGGFNQNQASTLRAQRNGASGSTGAATQSGLLSMVIQLLQRKTSTATAVSSTPSAAAETTPASTESLATPDPTP
jgi:hypothetical protein